MSLSRRFAAAALVTALLASSGAHAQAGAKLPEQGDERFWVLGIAGLLDDASNSGLLATFGYAPTSANWLSAAVGQSRSPERGANVVADTLELGFEHDFGPVGLGLTGERWGDSGDLESVDWRASLFFGNERYRITFERERRNIDLYFTITGPLGRTDRRGIGLDANGNTLRLRVDVAPLWQLYGTATRYRYSRDVSLLPRIASLNLLSSSTLTLANSFVDEYWTLGSERTVGNRLLSFGLSRDRSAVDGSTYRSVDAAFLFPVAPRMDLEFNLGRSESDLLQGGYYGGIQLFIYGGG